MPRKSAATPRWVDDARGLIKSQHGLGWGIREQSGKVKLTRRWADGTSSSVMLPLPWLPASATEILRQIEAIRSKIDQASVPLAEAARLQATSDAIASTTTDRVGDSASDGVNWLLLAQEFKLHKTHHTGEVKEATYEKMYAPALRHALELLGRRPCPRTGADLLGKLRDNCGGEPGTRGRQLRIQYAAQFLRFAVDRKGLPRHWLPPDDLATYIGKKRIPDRDGTPIKDSELVELLESIPDPRWYRAVALMACFGLRPVELRHCHPCPDGEQLMVMYQKRTSRGSTKARAVYGIDPVGLPGLSARLLAELRHAAEDQAGAVLPPLGHNDRDTASAISTYLRRRPVWEQIRARARNQNERITCYSFRHGYALRAHQAADLTPRVTAALMGHSPQTHNRHYGKWCDAETVAQAVQQGRAKLSALQVAQGC